MQHRGICNNAMMCKQWLLLAIYVPQRLSGGVLLVLVSAGGYVYCHQSEWILGNITMHDSVHYPAKVPL